MPKILPLTHEQGAYLFFCPGCQCGHRFTVPPWTFNEDMNKPTIRASYLIHGWEKEGVDPKYKIQERCHSYITDGMIQFLDDCGHELKGQTVELIDFDDLGKGE